MNRAKVFIVLTFLLAFAVCVSAQKSKVVKSQSLKLSASDKTEIINQVFADGFEKLMTNKENSAFQTCLIPIVENDKVIFISTEIEKKVVKPQFENYRFIVMSVDEMRKQVQKEKGECYFRLSQFIVSDSKVNITFLRYFNLPAYIYGTGFKYEFKKVNKKWEKHLLGNFTIQS